MGCQEGAARRRKAMGVRTRLGLQEEFGFSRRGAYLIVSLHPAFRIRAYQMTAIHGLPYTVGASLPKKEVR
jgi:hypothetical protein